MRYDELHRFALKEYLKGTWRGWEDNPITESNINHTPGFFVEVLWISCASKALHKYLLRLMQGFITDKEDRTVERYISFSRFLPGVLDRLHCDWCSVANGSLEYIKDTLESHPSSICDLKLSNLLRVSVPFYVMTKLKGSSVYGAKGIAIKDAKNFLISCGNKKPALRDIVTCKVFLDLHHMVSLVEKTWCPFKHMIDVGYSRDYRQDKLEAFFEYLLTQECKSRSETIKDMNDLLSTNPEIIDSPYSDYVEMFFAK